MNTSDNSHHATDRTLEQLLGRPAQSIRSVLHGVVAGC